MTSVATAVIPVQYQCVHKSMGCILGHLLELSAVRVAGGKVCVTRVVSHEVLGQEVDGIEITLSLLCILKTSL